MADIYMHSKLAEAVISKINYDFDPNIVYLGAQGPDPMYYVIFGKDSKEHRFIADRMHDTNTNMLLKNLVHYVKRHLTRESYSWLTGFICHYALDVKIHPYVYNNVGVYNKQEPATYPYRGLHLKFERAMDGVLIEDIEQKKAHKYKLTKKFITLKKAPDVVLEAVGYALKQTYGKDNGQALYEKGVQKMYKNVKYFITDTTGFKKQLYKLLDLFNKKTDLFYKDLSYYKYNEQYDYLNKQKQTWNHPISNQAYDYSVIELYDQAESFALSMMDKLDSYILKNKHVDLDTVFTNLSFNSGLSCDHHDKMKYFNIYRK